MAKNPGPASAPSAEAEFDYSKYLPADVKASDILFYDGLLPIYPADRAMAGKWEPVVGWCYGTEVLPTIRPGTATAFTPVMIRVCLTHPTSAMQGSKDKQKVVQLKAGDDVLVPVNKGMAINKKLENAITDAKQVPLMIFRVAGQVDTGQAEPMWDWEIVDTTKRQERKGKFAFPGNEVVLFNLAVRQLTANGTLFDGKTGEVLKENVPQPQ